MRTFVTGFGPFGTVTENPSATLAETCGRPFEVLEVAYVAADAFVDRLDPSSFDALLMLGVATGRHEPTPELFARNWRGDVADVRGVDDPGPIEEGQPLLIESTLWNPHLLAELEVHPGLHTSLDAGSYLCNYLSYRALRRFPEKRVGFLHIPAFEQMSREKQTEILNVVLEKIDIGE
jgi:pyrrolidone-carboxylate peptidase